MSVTKMTSELYCVNCEKNTIHEVLYVGDHIERITCLECETYLEIDENVVLSNYALDLWKRVRTKPERMTSEFKEDLSTFLCSMPMRVVTKPYRMVKEFKEIKDITKHSREV
ncbi:MAG: hypothetical protein PWQ12_783 [Clostridiales bacterium]|jgi:hypothetical protein|nr:hypothetical protein [Clostridiales bacterium]